MVSFCVKQELEALVAQFQADGDDDSDTDYVQYDLFCKLVTGVGPHSGLQA